MASAYSELNLFVHQYGQIMPYPASGSSCFPMFLTSYPPVLQARTSFRPRWMSFLSSCFPERYSCVYCFILRHPTFSVSER